MEYSTGLGRQEAQVQAKRRECSKKKGVQPVGKPRVEGVEEPTHLPSL